MADTKSMGVIYSVGCKQCGVWRDLDKFRVGYARDRDEAIECAQDLGLPDADSGRWAAFLLCDFMHKHVGHDCVFFDDLGGFDEAAPGFPTKDAEFFF